MVTKETGTVHALSEKNGPAGELVDRLMVFEVAVFQPRPRPSWDCTVVAAAQVPATRFCAVEVNTSLGSTVSVWVAVTRAGAALLRVSVGEPGVVSFHQKFWNNEVVAMVAVL